MGCAVGESRQRGKSSRSGAVRCFRVCRALLGFNHLFPGAGEGADGGRACRRPCTRGGGDLASAPMKLTSLLVAAFCVLGGSVFAAESGPPFPGKKSVWNGYDRYDFPVAGKNVLVVVPKAAAAGKPWVWHGEFFGHKPAPDVALLGGFHIIIPERAEPVGQSGSGRPLEPVLRGTDRKIRPRAKAALVGLSRGGLYCYNWAIANPTKVACLYGDAPVCDFKSWPGGKGKGKGSKGDWALTMKVYRFANEAEALIPGQPGGQPQATRRCQGAIAARLWRRG